MALCVDGAPAHQLCSMPTAVVPSHPTRRTITSPRRISPPPLSSSIALANSLCTGWEVSRLRRGNNGLTPSSMNAAVAPSKEAAGVTESGTFSQTDEELASRGLSCHSTVDDLDLDQLNSLFSKVSFPQREKQKLLCALQNTQALTWVQETESKRLLGFARATGDKVFHAIIWDVVVDPAYQGLGLGKVLMERLMADLVKMGISNIALYAEPTVVGFYQPLGFIADPNGIRAMAYSQRR